MTEHQRLWAVKWLLRDYTRTETGLGIVRLHLTPRQEGPLDSDDSNPLRYDRRVFEVRSIDEAKRVILTDEDGSTEERWQRETPYLVEHIAEFMGPDDGWLLADYGCGIGRVAKELIARTGCTVMGVDISRSMRQLAPGYVGDTRFAACAGAAFDGLVRHGLRVDGAIAVWSLQHMPRVEDDIRRIDRALKPGGRLFVCNLFKAVVPTDRGWVDLGFDIRALLAETFEPVSVDPVAPEHTTPGIAGRAFLGRYRKRA